MSGSLPGACGWARRSALVALIAALLALTASAVPRPAAASIGDVYEICNADTAYIYRYADTSSDRLKGLPRGSHFHVYYAANGTWAFGVHDYSGVSGYVLREKLC